MPFLATLEILLLNKLYSQLAPPCNFTCICPIENEQPVVLKTGWPLESLSNHNYHEGIHFAGKNW